VCARLDQGSCADADAHLLVVAVSTGEIVQRLEYDPWGRVTMNTNPRYL
jgi:YD repeat-containing protein